MDPTGGSMRHYFNDNLDTKVDPTTAGIKLLQTMEQAWSAAPNPHVNSVKVTLPDGKVRKVDYTDDSFTDSNNTVTCV